MTLRRTGCQRSSNNAPGRISRVRFIQAVAVATAFVAERGRGQARSRRDAGTRSKPTLSTAICIALSLASLWEHVRQILTTSTLFQHHSGGLLLRTLTSTSFTSPTMCWRPASVRQPCSNCPQCPQSLERQLTWPPAFIADHVGDSRGDQLIRGLQRAKRCTGNTACRVCRAPPDSRHRWSRTSSHVGRGRPGVADCEPGEIRGPCLEGGRDRAIAFAFESVTLDAQ